MTNSAPKRSRLLTELDHELGTEDAVGEAGIVLDIGGEHELPAGADALHDDRCEVRAARVHSSGEAGRPRSDDDDLVNLRHSRPSLARAQCPTERSCDHEDSTEDQIGEPDIAADHDEHPEQRDREHEHRDEHEEGDEQAEDDGPRGLLGGHDGLVADEADGLIERIDRVGCPVRHRVLPRSSGARGYPRGLSRAGGPRRGRRPPHRARWCRRPEWSPRRSCSRAEVPSADRDDGARGQLARTGQCAQLCDERGAAARCGGARGFRRTKGRAGGGAEPTEVRETPRDRRSRRDRAEERRCSSAVALLTRLLSKSPAQHPEPMSARPASRSSRSGRCCRDPVEREISDASGYDDDDDRRRGNGAGCVPDHRARGRRDLGGATRGSRW